MAKPVILFVSPIRLRPTLQGDRICLVEYARVLACFGSVHLLSICADDCPLLDCSSPFASESRIPVEQPSSLMFWALMVAQRRQPAFIRYRQKLIVEQIIEHAQTIGASHIHFEISTLAEIAAAVHDRARFETSIRLLNIESVSLGRIDRRAATSALRKGLFPLLAPIVNSASFRAEIAALKRLPRVQVISEGDCNILKANGVETVRIGPPFPDLPRQPIPDDTAHGVRLVFIGGLSHSSTGGGLKEFLEYFFPLVQKTEDKRTGMTLTIAGPDDDPDLSPWATNRFVTFAGFVSDASALLSKAHLMLACLREARGIRVKIIDALSRGMPVLAAEEALYGFDQDVRKVVFWYRDIMEVDGILRLVNDRPAALNEMGKAGRSYYEEHFLPSNCRAAVAAFHRFEKQEQPS
ncbi:MAG: hypothetical protein QOE70_992 [Chthoniobacter sp.]|jgi:glycosyltransferase involved in cell wall biosynthesis|nr:hypothetical protein [Chthoniobacter sp.]